MTHEVGVRGTSRTSAAAAWLLVAQGAASLGSLLLAISVARVSTAVEFGTFGLMLTAWMVSQRFNRIYLLVPRQILMNQGTSEECGPVPLGQAVLFSLPVSLALLTLGYVVGDGFLAWGLVLGLAIPVVNAYDALRNEHLSRTHYPTVAAFDLSWLGVQVTLALMCGLWGVNAPVFVIAWAAATLPGLAWGLRALPVSWSAHAARPRQGIRSGRLHDAVSDLINAVLVVQGVPLLVALMSSLVVVGGIRGALTLLGPLNVLTMALLPLLQINASNVRFRASVWRMTMVYSAAGGTACVVYVAILMVLPDRTGLALLGESWYTTERQVLGFGTQVAVSMPFIAGLTCLRSLGQLSVIAALKVGAAALSLCGAAAGMALDADIGAGWGIAGATAACAVLTLGILSRALSGSHDDA